MPIDLNLLVLDFKVEVHRFIILKKYRFLTFSQIVFANRPKIN